MRYYHIKHQIKLYFTQISHYRLLVVTAAPSLGCVISTFTVIVANEREIKMNERRMMAVNIMPRSDSKSYAYVMITAISNR